MTRTGLRRALYGRLAGDTTLTGMLGSSARGYAKAIYYGQPPEQAPHPYVLFYKSSGVPTETMGDPEAMENDVWLVKAVDHGTSADVAEAIAGRVQALLDDGALSIAGNTILLYLRRQSDIPDYFEVTDGETYFHVGSLYRLVTTS